MNLGTNAPLRIINKLKKSKTTEQELAFLVESYWNSKLIIANSIKYNCSNQSEIIKKALPEYIIKYLEEKPKREKDLQKWKKEYQENKAFFASPKGEKWVSINRNNKMKNRVIEYIKNVKQFIKEERARQKHWDPNATDRTIKRRVNFQVVRRFGHCPKWVLNDISDRTLWRNAEKYCGEIDNSKNVIYENRIAGLHPDLYPDSYHHRKYTHYKQTKEPLGSKKPTIQRMQHEVFRSYNKNCETCDEYITIKKGIPHDYDSNTIHTCLEDNR